MLDTAGNDWSTTKHFSNEWLNITSDKNILEIVTGVKLEFLTTPTQQEAVHANYNHGMTDIIESEVQSLLKKGVLAECDNSQDTFRSPIS